MPLKAFATVPAVPLPPSVPVRIAVTVKVSPLSGSVSLPPSAKALLITPLVALTMRVASSLTAPLSSRAVGVSFTAAKLRVTVAWLLVLTRKSPTVVRPYWNITVPLKLVSGTNLNLLARISSTLITSLSTTSRQTSPSLTCNLPLEANPEIEILAKLPPSTSESLTAPVPSAPNKALNVIKRSVSSVPEMVSLTATAVSLTLSSFKLTVISVVLTPSLAVTTMLRSFESVSKSLTKAVRPDVVRVISPAALIW